MRRFGLFLFLALVLPLFPASAPAATLYFPHADVTAGWNTRVCLVNTGTAAVIGSLTAMSDSGLAVGAPFQVELGSRQRRVIDVAEAFPGFARGYLVFNSGAATVVGYGEFSFEDRQRAAMPAMTSPSQGYLTLDHIDESAVWWTGVALVNTTDASREVTFRFADGAARSLTLAPHGHLSRTVSQIYGSAPPPAAARGAAVIESDPGLLGLELFGERPDPGHPERTAMDGIPLSAATRAELYILDYQDSPTWWTGIGVYNPGSDTAALLFLPYSGAGASLDGSFEGLVPGQGSYVTSSKDHGPNSAATWLKVRSSLPVRGLTLLGEENGRNLVALPAQGDRAPAGVLPKIESDDDTVIHLINANTGAATIIYRAYDDDGLLRAQNMETLEPWSKRQCTPGSLFFGMDVSQATYVTFVSTKPLMGFEYNHVNGTRLDAIAMLPWPAPTQPASAQLAAFLGAAAAMADGPKILALTDFTVAGQSYAGSIAYAGRPGALTAAISVRGEALGALELTCRLSEEAGLVLVDSVGPGRLEGREVSVSGLAFDPESGFDAPLAGEMRLQDVTAAVTVHIGED